MSSQIPFTISTPLRNVRLMEVSEELLEAITSGTTRLKFKSAPASSSTTTSEKETPPVMHLCSTDKAWAVRQVSTSNSVYVLRPSEVDRDGDGDGDGDVEMDGTVGSQVVTAVAQVGNFLELYPVNLDGAGVEGAVGELVPVLHSGLEGEEEEEPDLGLLAANDAKTPRTLAGLVDDVSAPDDVVLRACARLCVFESGGEGRCQIPSTRVLFDVWTKIVEGCAIEGIRLDADEVSLVRVVNVLSDEVEEKIAERMFEVDGLFDAVGLFEENRRRLKPPETCWFVAGLLLSSRSRGVDGSRWMDADAFMARWTDLVPSSFVKHCTLDGLTSSSRGFEVSRNNDEDGGAARVKWTGSDSEPPRDYVLAPALIVDEDTGRAKASTGSKPAAAAAFSAADKKRKWHEKFGAQRNAKK